MFESLTGGKSRNVQSVQPDAETSNTGKVLVRNLPTEIFEGLTQLAEAHDRSVEAEARTAIRAWVKDWNTEKSRANRCVQLAHRLNYLLDELNARPGRTASPSRIAEALGRSHADQVERWYAALEEPSFSDLADIARVMNCNFDWLAHGEEDPYKPIYQRIPEVPSEGVAWLLESPDSRPVKVIGLIRSNSKEGEFAYYKKYSDWGVQVFRTPYHVSEEIGGGGESSLAYLILALEALYKDWTTTGAAFEVAGYLVDDKSFSALLEGKRHPINILEAKAGCRSTWWEDIWDAQMFQKQKHWDGWRSLAERMDRTIEGNSRYRRHRDSLRGRIHKSDAI